MFGFFNVNKPVGPTSHDVVDQVRRLLGRGTKVGHAGTLDPFASGVLVICVGPATRLAEHVQAQAKRYAAQVTLGATSTTDDPDGQITPQPDAGPVNEQEVRSVLGRFVGTIRQVPPAHSAVKVGGRRAYKLARAGQPVLPAEREVTIYGIDLVRYAYPHLEIDVRCAGGTYIRALARDIGAALGVGGYCSRLARTAVGDFTIDKAVGPDQIDPTRDLIDPLAALADMPRVCISDDEIRRRLVTGSMVELPEQSPRGQVAAVDAEGRLLAVSRVGSDGKTLRAEKVFVQS